MLECDPLAQDKKLFEKNTAMFSSEHSKVRTTNVAVQDQLKGMCGVIARKKEWFNTKIAEFVVLGVDEQHREKSIQTSLLAGRENIQKRCERDFKESRKFFKVSQELPGNIRVFCRVRPLKHTSARPSAIVFPDANVHGHGSIQVNEKTFRFDHVFDQAATQQDVYRKTTGVIESVMDGYNVCIFAYGHSGSGKTHTMKGTDKDPGVNVRALKDLFDIASLRKEQSDLKISVSMLEIYNEDLRDLISPTTKKKSKLEILKDPNSTSSTAVHVPNLTDVAVNSFEEVWEVVQRGFMSRRTGRTNMNEHSSRSHLVLRITVKCNDIKTGLRTFGALSLVDLAGSERVARTNASGQRLKEAQHINKSLATLGDVFAALTSNAGHVPFRNSRLTYLLQDCLGGDSKTLMFVNVSGDSLDVTETVASLRFAQRVSKVKLGRATRHVQINLQQQFKAALRKKDNEISQLQARLSSAEENLRQRDGVLSDEKEKLKSLEAKLETAKFQSDEQMKRKDGMGCIEKELKKLKVQLELENAALHAKLTGMEAMVVAKEVEILRFHAAVAIKDSEKQALVRTMLAGLALVLKSSDTVADELEGGLSAETLIQMMISPAVKSTALPSHTERSANLQVQQSSTTNSLSGVSRAQIEVEVEESWRKDNCEVRPGSSSVVAGRSVEDSVAVSSTSNLCRLSRPMLFTPHHTVASATSAGNGTVSPGRNLQTFSSRVKESVSNGSSAVPSRIGMSTPTSSLNGKDRGLASLTQPTRASQVHLMHMIVMPTPQRKGAVAFAVRASAAATPSGL